MNLGKLLALLAIILAGCSGVAPERSGFSGFDEYHFLGTWKAAKTSETITIGGKDWEHGLEISVRGSVIKKDHIKVHGAKIEFELPRGEEYNLELSTADVLQTLAGDIRTKAGETRKVSYKKLSDRGGATRS